MNGFIIAFLILFGYFLPSIMAISNKKTNKSSIIIVNTFLGWTVVGWVVSLAWSVSKDSAPHEIIHKTEHGTAEKLEKLLNLKEKGALTEEEFAEQKKKILS